MFIINRIFITIMFILNTDQWIQSNNKPNQNCRYEFIKFKNEAKIWAYLFDMIFPMLLKLKK